MCVYVCEYHKWDTGGKKGYRLGEILFKACVYGGGSTVVLGNKEKPQAEFSEFRGGEDRRTDHGVMR